jgi:hypothetical protein
VPWPRRGDFQVYRKSECRRIGRVIGEGTPVKDLQTGVCQKDFHSETECDDEAIGYSEHPGQSKEKCADNAGRNYLQGGHGQMSVCVPGRRERCPSDGGGLKTPEQNTHDRL